MCDAPASAERRTLRDPITPDLAEAVREAFWRTAQEDVCSECDNHIRGNIEKVLDALRNELALRDRMGRDWRGAP